MASEREPELERPVAAIPARASDVHRQTLDAVRAGRGARLHARQGDRRHDTVFIGSFNLSHSGETNAENVLEIEDAALAERMAGFVDSIRVRYPALALN